MQFYHFSALRHHYTGVVITQVFVFRCHVFLYIYIVNSNVYLLCRWDPSLRDQLFLKMWGHPWNHGWRGQKLVEIQKPCLPPLPLFPDQTRPILGIRAWIRSRDIHFREYLEIVVQRVHSVANHWKCLWRKKKAHPTQTYADIQLGHSSTRGRMNDHQIIMEMHLNEGSSSFSDYQSYLYIYI